jgi:hypothetical protein
LVESTWKVVESTVTSPLKVATPNVVGTIAADPSKETPPIVRAVVNVAAVVAVAEFPLHVPAVVAEPAEPVVFWFRVGILAASRVPVVIFAVSKAGILAASRVPVVIFAVSKAGILAASRVPVVIFAVSKAGILATSSVPVICAAGSAVSPEPLPANVVAVTVPTTSRADVGAVVLPMEMLCVE